MRAALILACLVVLTILALWLFAGRHLVLLADRFFTAAPEALPTTPLIYAPGNFAIGAYVGSWLSINGEPFDARVEIEANGRLVLVAGGRAFPLGTRLAPPDPSGWPDIPYEPDPGDTIVLTRLQGSYAWPTWFETNFMTGNAPDWRRNLYYRLVWRKPDGRQLTVRWRWEEAHYATDGWSPARLDRLGATGLLELVITGSDSQ